MIFWYTPLQNVWHGSKSVVRFDQNFDPSLLTNKLWLIFMEKKQKKKIFWKKDQNGQLEKTVFFKIANSQYFFVKIVWTGPWISRIDWCERHWFSSTNMAVRLSDIFKGKNSLKTQILHFLPVFALMSDSLTTT